MRWEVHFADEATNDIARFIQHYDACGLPDVGERLVRRLLRAARQVETFSERFGRLRFADGEYSPHLRFIPAVGYKLVYRVDGERNEVLLIAIIADAQAPPSREGRLGAA